MERTGIYLDFDLCRKIMFRVEEVMAQEGTKGPEKYSFEGYSNELVGSNVRMLYDRGMITASQRAEFSIRGDTLRYWPTSLTEKGARFIQDFRNEEMFQEAVRLANQASGGATLKIFERHIAKLRKEPEFA